MCKRSNEEVIDEKINIIDFSDSKNIEEESSSFLKDLIEDYTSTDATNNLKLLLVIDEAHQFKQETLEKAVRLLRKYGAGLILISHTYADFNRGVRANIQTHIAMYTNWERDLSFIRQFQSKDGSDYTYLLRHIPEGYGIFRSRTVFRNQPVLCKFLQEYENVPYLENKSFDSLSEEIDDSTLDRRRIVLDLIRQNSGTTTEEIIPKLNIPKKEIRTVYRTVRFLENGGLVKVTTDNKNRKYYTAIS